MLRADGALELPPMRPAAAARFGTARQRPGRRRWLASRRRATPKPNLAVHARPWSQSLVSVAIRAPGNEVLSGTERLFPTDDDGLAAAAEWKGQLEYVCEQWLLDAATGDPSDVSDDVPGDEASEPDAQTAARLLGD